MKLSLWHNIKVGFPCGVAGGILMARIDGPRGYALGGVAVFAAVVSVTSVDRFVRFDYGAAVKAGIDHDRLADLLRQVGDSPRLPANVSFVPVVVTMTQALAEHP